MMMWHTVIGVGVYTRIMAMCDAVIGSENTIFFFKSAMHIRPRFPLEPRQ